VDCGSGNLVEVYQHFSETLVKFLHTTWSYIAPQRQPQILLDHSLMVAVIVIITDIVIIIVIIINIIKRTQQVGLAVTP
jgi:hypothetical protein